jgi:hypothetical protein
LLLADNTLSLCILLLRLALGGQVSCFHAVLSASAYGYQHPAHQSAALAARAVAHGEIIEEA